VARAKVGVQLSQQGTTIDELRASWRAAGDLGVDSLWVWDHFFPLYGDPNASHYEAYSLLGAMAVDTRHAQFGVALAHGLPVIKARLAELRAAGRDRAEIERTVAIRPDEVGSVDAYLDAGAQHVIVMMGPPYDLDPVRQPLEDGRA